MLSNGFLNILDLRISDQPFNWLQPRMVERRISRAICYQSGGWCLFFADGARIDAQLSGHWVLSGGLLIGLSWRTADASKAMCLTSLRWQDPNTIRRLLVRLRLPVPQRSRIV